MYFALTSAFYWIAVAAVIIVSSARLTRFLVHDKFPPVARLRDRYENRTDGSGWDLLTMCNYCMAIWVTPVVVGLADLAGVFDGRPVVSWFDTAWWIIFGTLAAAYLSAILVTFDGEPKESI